MRLGLSAGPGKWTDVMGIYSRDYLRETPPPTHGSRGFGGTERPWAIKFLLIANIAVFLLQKLFEQPAMWNGMPIRYSPVTEWLSLSWGDLQHFQLWRLLTYGFCHDPGNIGHIAFNLFGLWMFGRLIEPIYGSREFLSFYLASVLAGGLGHILAGFAFGNPNVPVVGASGGVVAVVILTAIHYPRMTVLLMMVFPIQMRWLAVMYIAVDVIGLLDVSSGVAHGAHLGGAAFALLYWSRKWRVSDWWSRWGQGVNWQLPKRQPHVKLYTPADEPDFDDRVDRILAKISEQGESSLTADEREILKTASRRARGRMGQG
jgi:membrane associated rhomboid family serine protease